MDKAFHLLPDREDVAVTAVEWVDDQIVFIPAIKASPFFRVATMNDSFNAIVAGMQRSKTMAATKHYRDEYWALHQGQEKHWQTADKAVVPIHCFITRAFYNVSFMRTESIKITTIDVVVANLLSDYGYEFKGLCWYPQAATIFRTSSSAPIRKLPTIVTDKMTYLPTYVVFARVHSLQAMDSCSSSGTAHLIVDDEYIGYHIPEDIIVHIRSGAVKFNDECWLGYVSTNLFVAATYHQVHHWTKDATNGGRYRVQYVFPNEGMALRWIKSIPPIRQSNDECNMECNMD